MIEGIARVPRPAESEITANCLTKSGRKSTNKIVELVESGVPEADAGVQAHHEFGNVTLYVETHDYCTAGSRLDFRCVFTTTVVDCLFISILLSVVS